MIKLPGVRDRFERPRESLSRDQQWFSEAIQIDYLHAMGEIWSAFRQYASMGHREEARALAPDLSVVGFDSESTLHFMGTAIGEGEAQDQLPRLLSELDSLLSIPGEEQFEKQEKELMRRVASLTRDYRKGALTAQDASTVMLQLGEESVRNRSSLLFLREVVEGLHFPQSIETELFTSIDTRLKSSGDFRPNGDHEIRRLFQVQLPHLPLTTLNESGRLPIDF